MSCKLVVAMTSKTGRIIRETRQNACLKQKDLAHQVGCAQQTIVDVESGKIARSRYLKDIADTLGIDYEALRNGELQRAGTKSYKEDVPVAHLGIEEVVDFVRNPQSAFVRQDNALPCPAPHSDRTFAFNVENDAAAPTVRRGETLFVDEGAELKSGAIVCVFIDQARIPTVRQAVRDGNQWLLVSLDSGDRKKAYWVDSLVDLEDREPASTHSSAYLVGCGIYASSIL